MSNVIYGNLLNQWDLGGQDEQLLEPQVLHEEEDDDVGDPPWMEHADINLSSFFPPHFAQSGLSSLFRARNSNRRPQSRHLYSCIGTTR